MESGKIRILPKIAIFVDFPHIFLQSSEIKNYEVYGEQNYEAVAWTRSSKELNGSSFDTYNIRLRQNPIVSQLQLKTKTFMQKTQSPNTNLTQFEVGEIKNGYFGQNAILKKIVGIDGVF